MYNTDVPLLAAHFAPAANSVIEGFILVKLVGGWVGEGSGEVVMSRVMFIVNSNSVAGAELETWSHASRLFIPDCTVQISLLKVTYLA